MATSSSSTAPLRQLGQHLVRSERSIYEKTETLSFLSRRLYQFADNIAMASGELLLDLAGFMQLLGPNKISHCSMMQNLGIVNVVGTTVVVGSFYLVHAYGSTLLPAAFGGSFVVSHVIVTVSNACGLIAFVINQYVHSIYESSQQEDRMAVGWSTLGIHVCLASALPITHLSQHVPLMRYTAIANGLLLNFCLYQLSRYTHKKKRMMIVSATNAQSSRSIRNCQIACNFITQQGDFSTWLVASQSALSMRNAALIWALWWPVVMPVTPLPPEYFLS